MFRGSIELWKPRSHSTTTSPPDSIPRTTPRRPHADPDRSRDQLDPAADSYAGRDAGGKETRTRSIHTPLNTQAGAAASPLWAGRPPNGGGGSNERGEPVTAPAAHSNSTAQDVPSAQRSRRQAMEDHAHGETQWDDARELRETRCAPPRGLFAPTDTGDAVADLIAVHGRELEHARRSSYGRPRPGAPRGADARAPRARRADSPGGLGGARRPAGGAERARRRARPARGGARGRGGPGRDARAQLGAVELRGAAVERREEAVCARAFELERQAGELAALAVARRARRSERRRRVAAGDRARRLHCRGAYRLFEREGPAPAPGDEVELDDGAYRCVRADDLAVSRRPPSVRAARAGTRARFGLSASGHGRTLSAQPGVEQPRRRRRARRRPRPRGTARTGASTLRAAAPAKAENPDRDQGPEQRADEQRDEHVPSQPRAEERGELDVTHPEARRVDEREHEEETAGRGRGERATRRRGSRIVCTTRAAAGPGARSGSG